MRKVLWLSEQVQAVCGDREAFSWVSTLDGEIYRSLEHRRTVRKTLGSLDAFIKTHRGSTWREILKNLVSLKLPVVSARNEWRALTRLHELGIGAPVVEGYGARGFLPHALESFIITRNIGEASSLEDICGSWPQTPPDYAFRYWLLKQVAHITRTLHDNGICHRDLYICHFMLVRDSGRLVLIDLHRALMKSGLSRRWKIKDVAALADSSRHIGLSQRDRMRFMKWYSGRPLRETLQQQASFWRAVNSRAERMYRRGQRR